MISILRILSENYLFWCKKDCLISSKLGIYPLFISSTPACKLHFISNFKLSPPAEQTFFRYFDIIFHHNTSINQWIKHFQWVYIEKTENTGQKYTLPYWRKLWNFFFGRTMRKQSSRPHFCKNSFFSPLQHSSFSPFFYFWPVGMYYTLKII